MRTARFIGSWLAGLLSLSTAALLFVLWLRFVLGSAEDTPVLLLLVVGLGLNLMVWSLIGLIRLVDESVHKLLRRDNATILPRREAPLPAGARVRDEDKRVTVASRSRGDDRYAPRHSGGRALASGPDTGEFEMPRVNTDPDTITLAVIIPAHNEEPVIDGAIRSALRLFDRWDIYVVSDSSKDATAEIAAQTGVNVLELLTNRGKAGAIEAVIQEFDLIENYDGVVILDADTELHEDYVRGVRDQFRDPTVAAVAGFVVAEWKPQQRTVVGRLISAYRDRLYWLLQYMLRFGQTWRFTSVSFIVPGFASTYRTGVLKHLEINPKGLVIEDFNMTFEVHHKKLGRISMRPDTKAYSQDPFTLRDYKSQVRRWSLGFWQTVRRHGVWPSMFWFSLFFYILEVVLVAAMLLVTALIFVFVLPPTLFGDGVLAFDWYADGYRAVTSVLPLSTVAVGLFVPDYILTCVIAMVRRRPSYLFYGFFFLPLRLLDSYLTLLTIPQAWTAKSDGRWKSPERVSIKV
ncbi:glycosyltransferase family 2 protein [Thermobifida halotolerans]|uniref:Glycosyltransferase family 2 protein n=1 Tax=Thermobifida halotolerans TaxID=483545 RepID=A0A399G0D4_9ACTN|nr:glycosyltransferase family 2 protein [Thermobifida halotolerans]UOE19232.1 glycosyltransferase family 2 protein [Thermobifida halotolerans]